LRLAALVGDGSLKPQLVERSWRDMAGLAGPLRDRQSRLSRRRSIIRPAAGAIIAGPVLPLAREAMSRRIVMDSGALAHPTARPARSRRQPTSSRRGSD
jgi:hypothetical protein